MSLLVELPKEKTLREIARRFPDADPASIEAVLLLKRSAACLEQILETHLANFDLSTGRFSILMLLMREGGDDGLSPSDLAQKSGVTRATITGLLDRLEKAGLVRRKDDPGDRRGMYIQLTPKGFKVIEAIMPSHCRNISKLMYRMGKEELKVFTANLKKIMGGLDGMQDEIAGEPVKKKAKKPR